MHTRFFRAGAGVLLVALLLWLVLPTPVWPAAYWFHGVRGRDVSVCFAGNAVTQRPARVREVVGHLLNYEYTANIKLLTLSGHSTGCRGRAVGQLE